MLKTALQIKQKERYQATLDDYFSFMEEFPESKYSKDVKKIYENTAKFLKIDNTDNLVKIFNRYIWITENQRHPQQQLPAILT